MDVEVHTYVDVQSLRTSALNILFLRVEADNDNNMRRDSSLSVLAGILYIVYSTYLDREVDQGI